jgi:hypothetical protein
MEQSKNKMKTYTMNIHIQLYYLDTILYLVNFYFLFELLSELFS